MQIIAGTLRGRTIHSIQGDAVRPTSSRTRESLFNILIHRKKLDGTHLLHDARFADLCCGSGAIGLEAISRGAREVLFVDSMREALTTTQKNASTLGVTHQSHFMTQDVTQLAPISRPYDVVFADPPYDVAWLPTLLDRLCTHHWLHDESLVIVEQRIRSERIDHPQLNLEDERSYGQSVLRFYHVNR